MKKIRFDLELNEEDFLALDSILDKSYRNRKNLCEALVKLLINTVKNKTTLINLNDLGIINPSKTK